MVNYATIKVMRRITIHEKAEYLSDAVFAASDGIVTTFAVVAGSAGASLDPKIVLILGFANLFADGFSMAAGNYLGVKSEIQYEEAKGKNVSHEGSPLKHGLITFIAVGITLFLVGFLRTIYTKRNLISSGVETFTVGGFAAFVAFFVGYLIKSLV